MLECTQTQRSSSWAINQDGWISGFNPAGWVSSEPGIEHQYAKKLCEGGQREKQDIRIESPKRMANACDGQTPRWTECHFDQMASSIHMSAAESKSTDIDATAHLFLRLTQGGAEGSCIQICSRCSLCPTSENPNIICNHALMVG